MAASSYFTGAAITGHHGFSPASGMINAVEIGIHVIFLPVINRDDYDAFQRILNNAFPDTYDEWGALHVKEAADMLGEGNEYSEVEVSPIEFARFCTVRRTSPSLSLLYEFAMLKASSQRQE